MPRGTIKSGSGSGGFTDDTLINWGRTSEGDSGSLTGALDAGDGNSGALPARSQAAKQRGV